MSPSSCDEFARCLHELIPPRRLCPRHRRPSLFVMDQEYLTKLERRVTSAMEAALQHDKFVSPLEVLVGIGWFPRSSIEAWRHARIACLEQASEESESSPRGCRALQPFAQAIRAPGCPRRGSCAGRRRETLSG